MRCFSSFPRLSLLIPNPPFRNAIHSLYKGSYFNHRLGITVTGQSFMHTFAEQPSQQGPVWRCRFHSLFWWSEYWLPWSAHLSATQKSNFLALIAGLFPALRHCRVIWGRMAEDGGSHNSSSSSALSRFFAAKGGSFSPTFPGNEHLVLCSSLVTQAYP